MKACLDGVDGDGGLENGLPQPFVESMRTLFDILDDRHTGRVKFADIERRWHEDEDCSSSGLPAGVLDSLRVVTPLDGYLSFSRFCKGLQICLLRSKSGNPSLMAPPGSSSLSSVSSGESTHSGRRSGYGREEDVPPPLPPPPPPALLDPQAHPPIYYHPHTAVKNYPSSIYISDRKPMKSSPITSVSQPNISRTLNGRTRPADSRDSFNLEQFLQTHHAKHRNSAYNEENDNQLRNHSSALYQRSVNGDKVSYGSSSENTVSHYNNSNNANICVSQSKTSNQHTNGIKFSPRKSITGRDGDAIRSVASSVHKADIRMGTGGMMSLYGTNISSTASYADTKNGQTLNQGPPKPPRTLESQTSDVNLKAGYSSTNTVRKSSNDLTSNNKMDAHSTYVSNVNIKNEKIYDRITRNPNIPSVSINGYNSHMNGNKTYSSHPSASLSNTTVVVSTAAPGVGSSSSPRGPSRAPAAVPSCVGRAPASLPLSVAPPNGYSLQRSQTHAHITTHSLERDARIDARNRLPVDSGIARPRRRGGSLERLLDSGVHHSRESSTDTTSTAPPPDTQWHWTANTAHQYNNNNNNNRNANNTGKNVKNVSPNKNSTTTNNNKLGSNIYASHSHQHGRSSSNELQQQSVKGDAGGDIRKSSREPVPLPEPSPADHRLTMNSYAWIRGGEDSSGSDVNTDQHQRYPVALTAAPTATTYGSSAATVTATATLAAPPTDAGVGVEARSHRKGRRREARRHTLQNGLDYAAVRRAGELEAERDMLHQGLQVVEQARQWYRHQLHSLLQMLHNEDNTQYNSEAQQQKLHYQLARITEINTQLAALMNVSEMPQHLALASTTPRLTTIAHTGVADAARDVNNKIESKVKRLRDQNQQLTEEVSHKSQHISVLEQDKTRLLRELFQARALNGAMSPGQADSTFM